MSGQYLAHSANDLGEVDLLRDHLTNVARLAAQYGRFLGFENEALLAGILHDIGKYGYLFRRRLEGKERGIDHWSAGAYLALTKYKLNGVAAALAIDGHHTGLQEASKDYLRGLMPEKLEGSHPLGLRLSEPKFDRLIDLFTSDGLILPEFTSNSKPSFSMMDRAYASSMLDLRMLYSTVVDADFIDTEAHFHPGPDGKKRYRMSGPKLAPQTLFDILMSHLLDLSSKVNASTSIKDIRSLLLQDCILAGSEAPGLFTLTAPTGSGKTLSMLAFALKHAAVNRLRRIITVIPYLGIIEQTAQEYRKAFSNSHLDLDTLILEDHSMARGVDDAASVRQDSDNETEGVRLNKLLSENWDAPIIVTTSVQFLESLFSNRSSSCRKLHRLANSVILFDEVQTLPVPLAIPTLATLSRLAERFGSTVVFSTATQPAFNHLDEQVRKFCVCGWSPVEVVSDVPGMFGLARRVKLGVKHGAGAIMRWAEIAEEMAVSEQCLCIVNLKRHALELFSELKGLCNSNLYHLSTNMCPIHRKKVLDDVRKCLRDGAPCRLVATQCVEAGVDLDFPVVFRSWGPLDSLSQAAGRCNRNGTAATGNFSIFVPEDESYPDGAYRQAAGVTRILLQKRLNAAMDQDINDPKLFEEYYKELYGITDLKNQALSEAVMRKDFAMTAQLYKLIPNRTINVLTPYDHERFEELGDEARVKGLFSKWISKARPFSIGLFKPNTSDPVVMYLDKIQVGRNSYSDDWFIYLAEEHYSNDVGLMPPASTDCLIA
jgi:CRISPR-associated helicase Cas3/CRISPR-associated endonuclease Cas3-HD